jgi:Tol biopolymer transport system component
MYKKRPFMLTAALVSIAVLFPATRTIAGSSTDDGRIAFVQGIDNGNSVGDIFTVNPDGGDLKQLTLFGATGGGITESWSPDGQKFLFSFLAADGSPAQIWEMNADGSKPHRLLKDPSAFDVSPSFSPDGSHIIFTRCGAVTCAIYRINADGSDLTPVTHFNHNPDVVDFWAAYSPDGGTIAFTSTTRGGLICAIYLMNADGSNIRPLTPPGITAWAPMWSPDGRKIAFATNFVAIHDEEIWTIDADGRHLTQLTHNNQNWNGYLSGAHDILPSWSPEGDAVAFERDAPDFSASTLYTVNADGSGERAVRTMGTLRAAPVLLHGRAFVPKSASRFLQVVASNAVYPRWGPELE